MEHLNGTSSPPLSAIDCRAHQARATGQVPLGPPAELSHLPDLLAVWEAGERTRVS